MSGLNNGSVGLFSGSPGLVIATGSGLYNDWSGLGGGSNTAQGTRLEETGVVRLQQNDVVRLEE